MKKTQLTVRDFIGSRSFGSSPALILLFAVLLFYPIRGYSAEGSDTGFSVVFNPQIRLCNDLDYSNMDSLVQGLFRKHNATTPREKAETIWRFLLTSSDYGGRAIYHLAGWAYEEPDGQILDPLKLLNVYGYGLCYQISPVMEAMYDAAGFEDARVWFLEGHTVCEVFYQGEYHYFDADLMGYSVKSEYKNPQTGVVAGVQDIIQDTTIITGKLLSAKAVNKNLVALPWYPYDVHSGVMDKILSLFTTRNNNWLFYDRRYSSAHSMHFVLRKGEKLLRYFGNDGHFYLPYKNIENSYCELPTDIAHYDIWVADGPHALRDKRSWGTGELVYAPDLADSGALYPDFSKNINYNFVLPERGETPQLLYPNHADERLAVTFKMQSPFVFIDAEIAGEISKGINPYRLRISFSTDWGKTWGGSRIEYLDRGLKFKARPRVIVKSKHGELTQVAGKYNYLVRIELLPGPKHDRAGLHHIVIKSRIQHNPRFLPALQPGENHLLVTFGDQVELQSVRPDISHLDKWALSTANFKYVSEDDQGFLRPDDNQQRTIIFKITAPGNGFIQRLQVGGRFLKLEKIAPDKLTAEIRKTRSGFNYENDNYQALIFVSENDSLSFKKIWEFDKKMAWKNNEPIKQFLRWPEVDRTIRFSVPVKTCYVKYQVQNIALDKIRFNVFYKRSQPAMMSQEMLITHVWQENGVEKRHTEIVAPDNGSDSYTLNLPEKKIVNKALIIKVHGGFDGNY